MSNLISRQPVQCEASSLLDTSDRLSLSIKPDEMLVPDGPIVASRLYRRNGVSLDYTECFMSNESVRFGPRYEVVRDGSEAASQRERCSKCGVLLMPLASFGSGLCERCSGELRRRQMVSGICSVRSCINPIECACDLCHARLCGRHIYDAAISEGGRDVVPMWLCGQCFDTFVRC